MSYFYEVKSNDATEAWKEYTRRKNQWVDLHPEATPAEYDAMIRALVEELGI